MKCNVMGHTWVTEDGDKYIMKKVRVVSLAHNTLTGPLLHPY